MVPFDVTIGDKRVGITVESLIWFFIVTAIATFLGTVLYYYVQPYLPSAVTQAISGQRTQTTKSATVTGA